MTDIKNPVGKAKRPVDPQLSGGATVPAIIYILLFLIIGLSLYILIFR